ncbi:MAG: hypothetical protein Ct9H300mP28_25500 [Pseudomonadota bacterium]|nr:MAG: hypothetical protein Ct9H300mP28_25500 [Pseudomonadota bacterium]
MGTITKNPQGFPINSKIISFGSMARRSFNVLGDAELGVDCKARMDWYC